MAQDGHAMQIDTPSVGVRTRQAGDVRISIAADGSSWITTRRGGVDVVTPQRTYTLGTGTTLIARGSASHPSVTYSSEVAFDSFDDFNAERDKAMVAALASPHLSPSIAGYDDLGAYGQWQAVVGYGQSWVPNEPAGWVPYRNGSWSWEGGYGWTWVGSEPWGWTPYHYGNWYYCGCGASGWAWLPPRSAATPAWSPALVGFFGFNTGAPDYNNCQGNYGYAPGTYSAPAAPSSSAVAPAATYSGSLPPRMASEALANLALAPMATPQPRTTAPDTHLNTPMPILISGGSRSRPTRNVLPVVPRLGVDRFWMGVSNPHHPHHQHHTHHQDLP